jgi:large subunit ribosomal protein L10
MPTAQKTERVAELRDRIQGSTALLLADYRGLTVSEISELRRSLREVETSLAVVKNTLMRLAVIEAGVEELQGFLSGPSAVAFVNGDPVAAAKRISAAARQFPALEVKGGWMDGRLMSAEQARALAELDSREVMLSKIAGMLKSEMTRAASMMQATQSRFLALLEAYREKQFPENGAETESREPVLPDGGADVQTTDVGSIEAPASGGGEE